jgi:hypothetical protein
MLGEYEAKVQWEFETARNFLNNRNDGKNMRSGPATQTAFADVNFTSAITRVLPPAWTCVVTNARYLVGHELRWRICTKGAVASGSRLAGLAVPPCETVSEEAATPGLPATLARFGNRSTARPRELPQNQPCAITGSVMSTPAVIAMSRIVNV